VFCGLGSHSGADASADACPPETAPVGCSSTDVSAVASASSTTEEESSDDPAVESPFDPSGLEVS
jgi:hypothetical protein